MEIDTPCPMCCLGTDQSSTVTGMVACHDVGTRPSTGLPSVQRSTENNGDSNVIARSCKQEPQSSLKQTPTPIATVEARQIWCCRPVVATRARLTRGSVERVKW